MSIDIFDIDGGGSIDYEECVKGYLSSLNSKSLNNSVTACRTVTVIIIVTVPETETETVTVTICLHSLSNYTTIL